MTERAKFLRRVMPLTLFPFIGFTAVLLFAALLISLRLEKSVGDLIEARTELIASQLNGVVEGGLRFGIPLQDQTALRGKMKTLIANDEQVLTVALFDDQGKRLLAEDRDGKIPDLDPRVVQRVLSQKPSKSAERYTRTWRANGEEHVVMQARDALGSTGGVVWIVYSATAAQVAFSTTMDRLLSAAMVMMIGGVFLFFLIVAFLWHKWERHLDSVHAQLLDLPQDDLATQESPLPGVSLGRVITKIRSAEDQLKAVELKVLKGSL